MVFKISFEYLIKTPYLKITGIEEEKERKKISIISVANVLTFHAFWLATLAYGNQVEEFAVPYQLISALICVRYCIKIQNDQNYNFKPMNGFILGICVAVTFWFKPTCTIVIIGCIIFAGIELIKAKKIKLIFQNIFFGILGITVISVPLMLYYYLNNALYDMIEQCFIFNFQYIENNNISTFQAKVLFILVTILFPATAIIMMIIKKAQPISMLFLCATAANAAMFVVTKVSYMFYAQVQLVCLLLLLLCIQDIKFKTKFFNSVTAVLLIISLLFCAADKYTKFNGSLPLFNEIYKNTDEFDDFYQNIKNNLNSKKTDTLILTDTYYENRYLYYHMHKYPFSNSFCLEFFERINAKSYIEKFANDFQTKPPEYIVIANNFSIDSQDYCIEYNEVLEKVKTDYTVTYSDNYYTLYELK